MSNGDDAHHSCPKQEMTRIMGLSTALANPYDLADWIGIDVHGHGPAAKRGLYNFRPSVRPIPMEVHIQGYPGRHYCPRMATMNKPCYAAIKEHSPSKPVIIFVASRRQTRLTAMDLISFAAGDENPRVFLGCSDDKIEAVTTSIGDASLRHTLSFGIGLHHAGLTSSDRDTVERLFLNGDIQVLVATATLAWGVNLPAHLVIVKGTEFFDGKSSRYVDYPVTDVLQMMGRAGRPQFDTHGIACVMVAEGKKNFYKKFLYEPFPVESCLGQRMEEGINAEVAIGTINSIGDAVGYLTWTFFARRAKMNPSFYGAKSGSDEDLEDFFFTTVKESIRKLAECDCVRIEDGTEADKIGDNCAVKTTTLGLAASNFYLQYRTPAQMRLGSREVRNIITRKLEEASDDQEKEDGSVKQQKVGSAKMRSTSAGADLMPYLIPPQVEEAAVAHMLYSLAHTCEFDELPVRHNEEELNAELSEAVPWGPDSRGVTGGDGRARSSRYGEEDADVMADPHTKCFLLLQAHIVHAQLPISDYITDTRSVLDQVPRLLAAMQYVSLDDSSTGGSFDLFCMFSRTRQVINRRTMVKADPLEQIPGLQRDAVHKLKSRGVNSLRDLCSLSRGEVSQKLNGVSGKGRRASPNAALNFIDGIPLVTLENVEVKCEVDKTSGKALGMLSCEVVAEYKADGKKQNGAGPRRQPSGRKGRGDDDAVSSLSLVLGTFQGRFLLSHKHITIGKGQSGHVRKELMMTFDWASANASGGAEGGCMVLRLLLEDIRGMDSEVLVPLR